MCCLIDVSDNMLLIALLMKNGLHSLSGPAIKGQKMCHAANIKNIDGILCSFETIWINCDGTC